jgi:hypothetical protein
VKRQKNRERKLKKKFKKARQSPRPNHGKKDRLRDIREKMARLLRRSENNKNHKGKKIKKEFRKPLKLAMFGGYRQRRVMRLNVGRKKRT